MFDFSLGLSVACGFWVRVGEIDRMECGKNHERAGELIWTKDEGGALSDMFQLCEAVSVLPGSRSACLL